MLVQVNELELCRGGKHTGTSCAVTIQCKVFATFDLTTETTASLPGTRRRRIRPSSIKTLWQMWWTPLLLPRLLLTTVPRA